MKKNFYSLLSLSFITLVLIVIRLYYFEEAKHIFTWDALGYYIYLPALYIYHDVAHLSWWAAVNSQYHFPGNFYQATLTPNGNFVFFYAIGVSILQTPFFFIGHWIAGVTGFPQDGFSAPYQLAVSIGMLVYSVLALIILRKVLLNYFSDKITAAALLLTALATNYPEYTAVEAGMSHGYLFMLYALLLLLTIRWHEHPSIIKALLIGFVIGLGTVCRPTEAVMIFIPLLLNTQTKELRVQKLHFLKRHWSHIIASMAGGFSALLPQFLYWKSVTGSWVHKMGSKWDFLNPHWRVIIGCEKAWFIYTPVTILMVLGIFFLRNKEYRRPVITYFLLNLWIIIAWHEWRYGGSYSARALVQSLAVMSIPLAAFIEKISLTRWKIAFTLLSIYLCVVNVFQVWQYNKTIIHYDDMNCRYYAAVYLNPFPSPIDMSLLDTDERLTGSSSYHVVNRIAVDSTFVLHGNDDSVCVLLEQRVSSFKAMTANEDIWIKVDLRVKSEWGAFGSFVVAELGEDSVLKSRVVRMQNGICSIDKWNPIGFYFLIPASAFNSNLKIFVRSVPSQKVSVRDFVCEIYSAK